jgi:hypothetical protein
MSRIRSLAFASFIILGSVAAVHARQLDYRNWDEGTLAMMVQSAMYDEAKLYVIGESSIPGIYQTAMLISEDAEAEDGGTKNAVLFECGMHSREWFATESCYWLIDYLLRNRNTPEVQELLAQADVWVIPQTNPAGRDIDDLAGGDPTQFAYVCDIGTNAGDACAGDADCPGGGCWKEGWRANADTSVCGVGVDPARNFSSGWSQAASLCTQRLCRDGGGYTTTTCASDADCSGGASCKNVRMQYRGPTPFSEPETLNLRRFVNNHMLSMAIVVHANSHEFWHRWHDINDASAYMTAQILTSNGAESAPYSPDPSLVLSGVGGGYGQFSAWLTSESDRAGEPDQGTRRNISTFYIELPIMSDRYQSPYRHSATDTSNSFHPSSDTMKDLWEDAIRDAYLYVIRQGRSPLCPVDAAGMRVSAECELHEFGLVGAKLADATDAPGLLDYDGETREEILPSGTRQIVFAVQNFSASANSTTTNATVTVTKDGSPDGAPIVPISLMMGSRSTYSVSHLFSTGSVYKVEIALDSDDFTRNNTKIFKFRARSTQPQFRMAAPGWSKVKLNLREEQPGADDSLRYRGRFVLGREVHPDTTGVEVLIRGRGAHAPQIPAPGTLAYTLPSGSPWWDRSKPEKGRWIYLDPEAAKSPVTKVTIKQRVDPDTGDRLTKVVLKVENADLSSLDGSRSYTVDLSFPGDDLRLNSVASGRPPSLPDKALPPDDGTEEEPDHPLQ